MTAFSLMALLMVLIAVAAVAVPLLRHRAAARPDDEATLAAYRDRDAELAREHERGNLDDEEFREAREELERELLAATSDGASPRTITGAGTPRKTLIGASLLVPVVAVIVYAVTGQPGLIGRDTGQGLSPAQIEQFRSMPPARRIARLEPLVKRQPDATRAWVLLARAYRDTERYGDAVNAYARVRAQGESNPWLLARQAEALLLANGRRFTESVEALVQQALEKDQSNPLALMLAGHAAMARGDGEQAAAYWERLADDMPEGSDNRAMLERLIARARGEDVPVRSADGGGATAAAGTGSASGDGGPSVAVRVSLASELADAAPADTPVFIFARPAGGSGGGPPLAVHRTTVGALPTDVTLSDAQSMTPARKLSQADRVRITARAALQGGVMAQSGDLQGRSDAVDVAPGAEAAVTIDQRIP